MILSTFSWQSALLSVDVFVALSKKMVVVSSDTSYTKATCNGKDLYIKKTLKQLKSLLQCILRPCWIMLLEVFLHFFLSRHLLQNTRKPKQTMSYKFMVGVPSRSAWKAWGLISTRCFAQSIKIKYQVWILDDKDQDIAQMERDDRKEWGFFVPAFNEWLWEPTIHQSFLES